MTTKGITSPAPGSSNWDVPLNANFAAIEKAFGDATSIATAAGAVTLNTNQIGHMCLRCTGALTANLTLQVPSGTAGQWVVVNATTDATGGPWTVSITSLAGGTPIQIARGSARSVYADGTSNGVVFADTINIPGSDRQVIYNDAGVLAGSPAFKFDGAAVSVGNQAAITITGASWSLGTATVTFGTSPVIPVGSIVSITGVAPTGYNGSWVTTGTATATQVQFAVATNPGSYISGGQLYYGNLNLGGSLIGGIASQALAEAGTNDTSVMTPERAKQAIDAQVPAQITTARVLAATAGATVGSVGTYGLFTCSAGGTVSAGSTVAGSSLEYASVSSGGVVKSGTPSGTWRCMGHRGTSTTVTTVYLRIS